MKSQSQFISEITSAHPPRIIGINEIMAVREGHAILSEALSTLSEVLLTLSPHASHTKNGRAAVETAMASVNRLSARAAQFVHGNGNHYPTDEAG